MQKLVFNNSKLLVILMALILFAACSSSGDGSGNNADITPSNLVVGTNIAGKSVANPNGDGSGVVTLNISATNATSYKISYGDGTVLDATAGINSYTYKIGGTFSYIVTITAFNGVKSISSTVTVTISVSTAPIWSDEFNTNGAPDISKWNYDIGTGSGGWGNNESQNYTNRTDNVKVENGVLKIIVKKESYQGSNYTSARLKSQGKFSVQYGKIEFSKTTCWRRNLASAMDARRQY